MNKISVTILLFSVLAVFGLSAQKTGHYVVKIEDFTQLKVIDGVNVIYKSSVDSAGLAVFDAADNVASLLVFSPNKGKLTIQYDVRNEKYKDLPTITVYSKFITSIENHSDSLIRVINANPSPEFKLKVMGNGRIIARDIVVNKLSANITTGRGMIIATGQCDEANLTNLGAGQIQADMLKAGDVKCKLGGTGVIGCYAVNHLDVIGVGTGKIYYRGTPKSIDKNTIKTQVLQLEEDEDEDVD